MSSTDATTYDAAYYAANQQGGDRTALWFYARVAGRLAPAGGRALDYGCGTGHFSRRLARRFESLAYDVSEFARTRTAQVSPATRVVDNLGRIPARSLDLVCTLHVLEHVPAPGETIARLASLLRPGGRLMYVVPNPQGLGHRLRGAEWFAYRDETHCSLLDGGEWLALTGSAGLMVERVAADGLWDPPYVRRVPRPLQLAVFGLPAAAQVLAGRAVLPRNWGECIIVTARRPAD